MGTVTKLRAMLCCTAELIQQLPSSHSFLSQLGHLAPFLTPSHPAHPMYIKPIAPGAQQNMFSIHFQLVLLSSEEDDPEGQEAGQLWF